MPARRVAVRPLVEPEGFIRQRQAALMSREACAAALGVEVRTVRNWETGKTRVPYAAFKLLRLLTGGELPGAAWAGFFVRGNVLYSPEQKAFTAGELAYLSNVFAMARFWLQEYQARGAARHRGTPLAGRGAKPRSALPSYQQTARLTGYRRPQAVPQVAESAGQHLPIVGVAFDLAAPALAYAANDPSPRSVIRGENRTPPQRANDFNSLIRWLK